MERTIYLHSSPSNVHYMVVQGHSSRNKKHSESEDLRRPYFEERETV